MAEQVRAAVQIGPRLIEIQRFPIETLGGEVAGAQAVHVSVHPGNDAG